MIKIVRFIFIFIFISLIAFSSDAVSESNYSDKQNKAMDSLFFPKEIALKDGYRITPIEWVSLDASQKKIFIIEGIEEIKSKEKCFVKDIIDMPGLIDSFNKTIHVLALNRNKTAVISILFRMLDARGDLKCDKIKFKKLMDYINNQAISPNVEMSKNYNGYADFYKKDGGWFMGKRPPKIGEICKHFIYNNYTVFPSGMVILSGNYPLDFSYKISSIKEINSFMQDDGLLVHYYEVTFECVEKQ